MKFSWQECMLSGVPFPTPADLPNPGIKPPSLESPALVGRFFMTSATWEAPIEPPGKPIYLSVLLLKEISLFSFCSLLPLTMKNVLSCDFFFSVWLCSLGYILRNRLSSCAGYFPVLFPPLLCFSSFFFVSLYIASLGSRAFGFLELHSVGGTRRRSRSKKREVKVSPPLCLPALRQWLRACPYLQALPPPPFLLVPPPLFLPLLSSIRLFPCLVPLSLGMLFFDWPQQPLFTPLTGATHL